MCSDNNRAYQLLHSEKVYKLEKGNYKIVINSDSKEKSTRNSLIISLMSYLV
jgi:hypothetical protein